MGQGSAELRSTWTVKCVSGFIYAKHTNCLHKLAKRRQTLEDSLVTHREATWPFTFDPHNLRYLRSSRRFQKALSVFEMEILGVRATNRLHMLPISLIKLSYIRGWDATLWFVISVACRVLLRHCVLYMITFQQKCFGNSPKQLIKL